MEASSNNTEVSYAYPNYQNVEQNLEIVRNYLPLGEVNSNFFFQILSNGGEMRNALGGMEKIKVLKKAGKIIGVTHTTISQTKCYLIQSIVLNPLLKAKSRKPAIAYMVNEIIKNALKHKCRNIYLTFPSKSDLKDLQNFENLNPRIRKDKKNFQDIKVVENSSQTKFKDQQKVEREIGYYVKWFKPIWIHPIQWKFATREERINLAMESGILELKYPLRGPVHLEAIDQTNRPALDVYPLELPLQEETQPMQEDDGYVTEVVDTNISYSPPPSPLDFSLMDVIWPMDADPQETSKPDPSTEKQ